MYPAVSPCVQNINSFYKVLVKIFHAINMNIGYASTCPETMDIGTTSIRLLASKT